MAHTLTEQMHAIVHSNAARLAVRAGAGTGKTTTAAAYARRRASDRGLYLAFAKSVQLEAVERMPRSVESRTTHSIAGEVMVPRLFGDNGGWSRIGATYPRTIAQHYGVEPLAAMAVIQTINAWCCTTDDEIGERHIPTALARMIVDKAGLVGMAKSVWDDMIGCKHEDVRLPHDGYLKLYQLARPKWRVPGLRYVIVDEAQDLNACTWEVIQAQEHIDQVLIGDSAQQIFQFRGSMDALQAMQADERLTLSRSFRFGPLVARLANLLLTHYSDFDQLTLQGAGEHPGALGVDILQPHAVICRTNTGVFEFAVDAMIKSRMPLHFSGGPASYRLDMVADACHLMMRQRPLMRDPYLRSFASFDDLANLAETSQDVELGGIVKSVCRHGSSVIELIEKLKKRHVEWTGSAKDFPGVFLTTAHKAKGLEFRACVLGDDFMAFFDHHGDELAPELADQAEVNLLYVALTRAMQKIEPPGRFMRWIEHRGFSL